MSTIGARTSINLVWDDDANEWRVGVEDLVGPLGWDIVPTVVSDDDSDEAWAAAERARNHPVTAEDLTHMLGFAMVRATAPTNADVEWRPASPHLIGMLKDVMDEHLGATIPIAARDKVIRALVPIISSVDENAHRRGMFDQRKAALDQGGVS